MELKLVDLPPGRNELYADSRTEFDTAVRGGSKIAVVRLWNNRGEEFLDALFRRIERAHKFLPIDGLVLSFNGNKDQGQASATLDSVRFPTEFPVKVMEVIGDPSVREWTSTANGPVAYFVNHLGIRKGHIWYISGDVEIDLESLRRAVPLMDMGLPMPFVSVRKEPAHLAPEGDVRHWVNQAKAALIEIRDEYQHRGNLAARLYQLPIYLQRVARNTCQMWNLAHLIKREGFDPRCNPWLGQEDTAYLIWLMCCMGLNLDVPVVEYRDPNLFLTDSKAIENQRNKIEAEAGAIRRIIEEYIIHGGMQIPVPDFNWNI